MKTVSYFVVFYSILVLVGVAAPSLGEQFENQLRAIGGKQLVADVSKSMFVVVESPHESGEGAVMVAIDNDADKGNRISTQKKGGTLTSFGAVPSDDRFFNRIFLFSFVADVFERAPEKDPFPPGLGGVGYYIRLAIGDSYRFYYRQDIVSIRRLMKKAKGEKGAKGEKEAKDEEDIDIRAEQSFVALISYLLGRVASVK